VDSGHLRAGSAETVATIDLQITEFHRAALRLRWWSPVALVNEYFAHVPYEQVYLQVRRRAGSYGAQRLSSSCP
jgi:hypothetical protein